MAEAIRLLDLQGVEALTMRSLAQHLDVSPMALYNHVSSKRDLVHGITDAIVSELSFPADQIDMRERIRACFRSLRAQCRAHPNVIRLIKSADVLPSVIFLPMEITLAALEEMGIGPPGALRAYFLLVNFTMGQVSYEIEKPSRGLDPSEAVRSRRISEKNFPRISHQTPHGIDWDFDAAFEFGLTVILAGLKSRTALIAKGDVEEIRSI